MFVHNSRAISIHTLLLICDSQQQSLGWALPFMSSKEFERGAKKKRKPSAFHMCSCHNNDTFQVFFSFFFKEAYIFFIFIYIPHCCSWVGLFLLVFWIIKKRKEKKNLKRDEGVASSSCGFHGYTCDISQLLFQ